MYDEEEEISNENIEHLIFRTEPVELKFPMYRSKFSSKVREDSKVGKRCHQTFGYAHDYPKIDPTKDYLKKGTTVICRPLVDVPRPGPSTRKPVPRKEDWNERPSRVQPNYILTNIKKVNKAIPKTGPSRYVTTKGLRFHNCNLLMPKFRWDKGFGKVPKYLYTVKEELAKEIHEKEEKWKKRVEHQKQTGGLIRISSEERQELLDGLKVAWAGLQKEFQLLPMLNDTPPKIKHKEYLERELMALEKEIQTIEDHQIIYIYNDPTDPACEQYKKKADPCYEHIARPNIY